MWLFSILFCCSCVKPSDMVFVLSFEPVVSASARVGRCDTRGTSCLPRGLSDCELNLCSKSLISFERFFFVSLKFSVLS